MEGSKENTERIRLLVSDAQTRKLSGPFRGYRRTERAGKLTLKIASGQNEKMQRSEWDQDGTVGDGQQK